MRESPVFEVQLRRFGVWHAGVGALASAAWTLASASSPGVARGVPVLAALLALGTIVVSLAPIPSGVLSRRLGEWTYTSDSGRAFSGTLVVAIDLGSFVLLRLDLTRHRRLWLPVQRRDWSASGTLCAARYIRGLPLRRRHLRQRLSPNERSGR